MVPPSFLDLECQAAFTASHSARGAKRCESTQPFPLPEERSCETRTNKSFNYLRRKKQWLPRVINDIRRW